MSRMSLGFTVVAGLVLLGSAAHAGCTDPGSLRCGRRSMASARATATTGNLSAVWPIM
jgi:hypothetical protein